MDVAHMIPRLLPEPGVGDIDRWRAWSEGDGELTAGEDPRIVVAALLAHSGHSVRGRRDASGIAKRLAEIEADADRAERDAEDAASHAAGIASEVRALREELGITDD